MRLTILIVILAILAWIIGGRWLLKQMDRDVQSRPKVCPEWLMDSPQKGCEGGQGE